MATTKGKNPVGRPRTVNKDLAPGLTRSGNPPRVRVSGSAAGKRDAYQYRQEAEKKLGHPLGYNQVFDHANPDTKGQVNPKGTIISRSENSKKDGGLRRNAQGKMVPSKGKGKK